MREIFDYLQVKQRFVLCYFSLLAIINAYTIRHCLDFSLNRIMRESKRLSKAKPTKMSLKGKPISRSSRNTVVTFPQQTRQKAGRDVVKITKRQMKEKLLQTSVITTSNSSDVWTKQVQILVTVSFYAGYMITHIPGGRLAERYGGKWILGASILLSAILTLLTPTIVRNGGPGALMLLRLLIGFCEGPTFPAVSALLAQWVPENERGLLCSCVLSGGEIGITFVHLVNGMGLKDEDWAVAFYVVGSGALLWFVGFILVCYSKPDASPYIQNSERDYIRRQVSATLLTTVEADEVVNEATPWSNMLMNAPIWALIAANMQHDWDQQEMAQELEKLLQDLQTKGSTLWKGLESSLRVTAPHLYSWLASLTSGTLCDYLIAHGILSRTQTRRLMSWLIFVSISMYLVHEKEDGARAWSVLAFGAYYAGIKVLPLDMSPNFAGTLMGISNGLGSLPGLLLPLLQQLESEYAIVGSIRAALWLICAGYISGDVQSYNRMPMRQAEG
ncbi:putative inorganic phosphate cotransporter [Drosophila innubila]|uniref:putative inorganic phosphate cotransporter n=1 Tax=Drosophila innubila TaxID=198719 RepID=UPI00148CFD0B|nr:putative inorganic phosphate cotransporter [Drosophila innubila]